MQKLTLRKSLKLIAKFFNSFPDVIMRTLKFQLAALAAVLCAVSAASLLDFENKHRHHPSPAPAPVPAPGPAHHNPDVNRKYTFDLRNLSALVAAALVRPALCTLSVLRLLLDASVTLLI